VSTDDDLELLKHASAYHLKLSESILQEIPDHVQLAESVTRGYAQYAYVFLMDEADRAESDSVQQASLLRNRAAKMLGRAKSTGLKTLSLYYPGLLDQLEGKTNAKPLVISQSHVGLTYWSMTAWAGAISLSKDSPDVVADLPAVIKLSELAWKANPKYDHGALASMMGTLELSKPGGKAETAQNYYDLAIQWRGDQIAPLVAKAENWAVATQHKDAFVQLLQQAIALSDKQKDLTNTVMGRRARWLLDNVDNYF
jgi:predicted anti-sigma-YlaC factor YlaD